MFEAKAQTKRHCENWLNIPDLSKWKSQTSLALQACAKQLLLDLQCGGML